ncbi:angiotensinogen isoform X2 [Mixophyes fleayi]
MYIQKLVFLTACIGLSTCNRVYVHPFNLFAFNKSECEKVQSQNHTIENMFIPIPIESKMKGEDKSVKVKTYQETRQLGTSESYLTSLMNDLGFRAFKQWREIYRSDTVLISCTNLYGSLMSFYLGASEHTSTSLQDFLGFGHPSGATNCSSQVNGLKVISKLKIIDNLLFSKNANIDALKTTCIFVSPSLSLSEKFVHDLTSSADHFYVRAVDFTDSVTAINLINKFLETQLAKKSKSGLTSIDVTSNFMYTSHIQFKGKVSKSFLIPELQHFWIEPNRKILVPMISVSGVFQFKEDYTSNQLVLKISLSENDFLLLVQPTNGNTLENIESSLTWDTYLKWLNSLTNRYISLSLPKLEIESALNIQDLLTNLEVSYLLGKDADFSKISNANIKLGKVINTVHFELEDSGADPNEAQDDHKNKEEPLKLNFDKPFIVAMFEGSTKALLLLGRVVNPVNII